MRTLPEGIDQRSACRHPDWTGPDDLEIKIEELREITDWEKPIYVKVGASRPYYDIALAVKAGADVIVVDGMQGGTAATQEVFIEHVGIPTLAAIRPAVQALQDLGMHRKVQLIVSGGIRSGADVAKALALGADAVSIGTAALVALGDNDPALEAEYEALGTTAGAYDDWHEGRDPAGITTQDPELAARLDPVLAGRRLANYLAVLTLEAQTIARACGKSHLHNLEPEDLVALTIEAAAMARRAAGRHRLDSRAGTDAEARSAARSKRTPWHRSGSSGERRAASSISSFPIPTCSACMRAKLVPAAAIAQMQKNGAGFAGFATWLDMTPADPDMFAVPDPDSLDPTALEAGGRLAGRRSWIATASRCAQAPRNRAEAHDRRRPRRSAMRCKTGVECEFFLISTGRQGASPMPPTGSRSPATTRSALMRRYDVITRICDAMLALGWEPYQNDHEDANGQFEMNWEYDDALVTADRHAFFKYMVKIDRRKARAARDLHAEAVPRPDRHRLPCPCVAVAGRTRTCSRIRRASWACRALGYSSSAA